MSFINMRQLSQLVNSSKVQKGYEETADKFQKKYNMKIQHEDLQNLIQTATRINKREKTKENKTKNKQQSQQYEIFVFGELKIFNWVLILYSHINNLNLQDYKQVQINKMQSIFKKKSRIFIEYHIKDIIHAKQKNSKQWQNEQIQLFKEIMSNKQNQSEWKSISYDLYCQSKGKYFKSFSMCRQKWISHLNPNIKKTDWTLEEDVQLFSMIKSYGCRWALISRELKGIRSEHSVKNRYNVVVKTIKRQYRLGDTHQLNQKILKYLKMKLQKQKENQSELNMSDYSLDSKCSRERSREEEKLRLNSSQDSRQQEQNDTFNVFNEIYHLSPPCSQTFNDIISRSSTQQFALRDYYNDLKGEKKTNDQDDQEQKPTKLKQCLLQLQQKQSSDVRTNTLEELDRQYRRLLNFQDHEHKEEILQCQLPNLSNNMVNQGWLQDKYEGSICWYDLQ